MEVGLGACDGRPAQEVGLKTAIAALVEVTLKALGSALKAQQREGYYLDHPPALTLAHLIDRLVWQGAKVTHERHTLLVEVVGIAARTAEGRKGGAYAVNLEVEVTLSRGILNEELHTAILPHGAIARSGHSTKVILLNLEQKRQRSIGVGYAHTHAGSIGVCLPIDTIDGDGLQAVAHNKTHLVVAQ